MSGKKYFQITEVSEILGVSNDVLRKLEKSSPHIRVKKMRNRRYYTESDILKISQILCLDFSLNLLNNNIDNVDNTSTATEEQIILTEEEKRQILNTYESLKDIKQSLEKIISQKLHSEKLEKILVAIT